MNKNKELTLKDVYDILYSKFTSKNDVPVENRAVILSKEWEIIKPVLENYLNKKEKHGKKSLFIRN